MIRDRALLRVLIAVLAVLSLSVAAVGCGGDDVGSVVSDITQPETGDSGRAAEDIASSAASEGTSAPGGSESAGTTGGGETSGGAAAAAIEIPADEQALAYAKTSATAQAGEVTLRMPNPSPIPHNIAVDEPEQVLGEVVQMGGVSEITVDFPAGEYEYYCSVPGHREAGMVGTLTVE